MSDGGKGSSPRPFSVSNEEYANRWDAIFGRDPREIEDAKNEDEAFDAIMKHRKDVYENKLNSK
jgi:hypothetical protein